MSQISSTRIVIAEDSRIQAKMLMKRLEDAGYDVRWGDNGRSALDHVQHSPPDLIISDIEMPVMTGYEFCQAVKTDPQLKHIPLILLSTLSAPEDIIDGLQAGADNYVTKPYQTEYLLERVTSLLNTPIEDDDDASSPALEVNLKGKTYVVRSGRQQMLNLLISTFENAVAKNSELILANQQLSASKDLLARQNVKLEQFNEQLENANAKMKRDLDAAARIQHSLLPSGDVKISGVDIAWRYIPCDELAGDFLNFFLLDDDHLALYVVDVSGHGVASSLLSVAVARSMSRQITSSSILAYTNEAGDTVINSPAKVATELNRRFPMEEQGELYFTMFYGVLNRKTGQLRYVSAGHVPSIHVPVDGDPVLLPAEGFAVGWFEEIDIAEETVTLQPGDRLLLVSDGVPEAMDEELEEFGDDQMLAAVAETSDASVENAVAHIRAKVDDWCRVKGPKDDVSILGIDLIGEN